MMRILCVKLLGLVFCLSLAFPGLGTAAPSVAERGAAKSQSLDPPLPAVDTYPVGSAIGWQPFSSALFYRARTENRPLFIYFHGQWCTWCRSFQDQTLENPKVAEQINRDFIPVLIDLDRRRDLFTRYGGRGLPYVVIVDAADTLRARFTGHLGAAELSAVLAEQRQQVSATGRELSLLDAPITSEVEFLDMLSEVYDPATQRLTGSAFFGTLSKRPQPWTFLFLLQHPDWAERMPLLLDQLAEDLADPVDGGFFFFFDPDQADFVQARETSKRLDQNAAMLWLFAEAWDHFDELRYYQIVRRTLTYLREHLWHAGERRFYASQYSDPIYYQQPPETRALHPSPPVDAVTYADFSGQVIAALFRTGMILQDDDVLAWAKEGLEGLDHALWGGDAVGYWHALTADGQRELTGYLPAQIWSAIAWQQFAQAKPASGGQRTRERVLLELILKFHDSDLGAFRERRVVNLPAHDLGSDDLSINAPSFYDRAAVDLVADGVLGDGLTTVDVSADDLPPWAETRTHAILAWWLAGLPQQWLNEAAINWTQIQQFLRLPAGADPDDVALGFLAFSAATPSAATPSAATPSAATPSAVPR